MAPTICSEKKTQQRSGINDIRKQSTITSLSTSPSSSLNYAQKRSKLIRPYPAREKRPITDNSVYHISSSSDASNDTNECFRSNSPSQSVPTSISDNSISTSSESSLLSPLSLSAFSSAFVSGDEDYTPCEDRLKPFYHNIDLSSVYTISSSDEEKNFDDDMISRSFNVITSDSSQDKVTSTIDDDKHNFRSLSKLQMQQETKHTKGLFEIAIKMIKLVHRNQLLQRRLSQLQTETSQFIQSVLANPENQAFRDKVQANNCCEKLRD
ncbi:uncharacterized protein LOC129913123 [Episyrphus balteatus]|uniref:uncharacterized protein LOC129913123 n=1 Tax=Episyrphus balteatus TaxID=286459 RepID=UPI002485848C|nr:uncharacterized protein LOC129913123 [Episyrphus balteatus]